MRSAIARRLGSIERTFGAGASISQLPHPLDVIRSEDRALVLQGKARERGEPLHTPEVHGAMRRFLRAAANYDEMRRKAGVQLRPIAETIREGRFRRCQVVLEAAL